MKVRKAQFSDLDQICTLVKEFFQQTCDGVLNGAQVTPDGIIHTILGYFKNPHTLILVDEAEDRHLCGVFVAELYYCHYNDTCYARDALLHIRRGVKHWLEQGLPLVEQWMKKYSATHLLVQPTKSKNNKALAELLHRKGFKKEGYVLSYGPNV